MNGKKLKVDETSFLVKNEHLNYIYEGKEYIHAYTFFHINSFFIITVFLEVQKSLLVRSILLRNIVNFVKNINCLIPHFNIRYKQLQ